MKKHFYTTICFIFLHLSTVLAQKTENVNWEKFFQQHDLVWEELPLQWNEGVFVGNDNVGMMIYATLKDNRLDFHLGRQDVTDHRKAPLQKTAMYEPSASVHYDYPRLDIGRMALIPTGKIVGGSVRVYLWNAEVRGTLKTDLGQLTFRAYTPYQQDVQVIEISSTEKTTTGERVPYRWQFQAGNAASARVAIFPDNKDSKSYQHNPKPVFSNKDAYSICTQPLSAGGDFATVWLEKKTADNASVLFVSTANEVPKAGFSAKKAEKTIETTTPQYPKKLEAQHREWWHAYYQKSFLSVPDAQLEAFYWIQLYKLGTCGRADGTVIDLLGVYYKPTQWLGVWWNLNVQLTYWACYPSNHADLGVPLIEAIDAHFDVLLKKFDNAKLGDFTWTMHNYWLHYRFEGNKKALFDKWLPKAARVIEAYQRKLRPNTEGVLELAPMESPEYKGFEKYPNSNYNLALLRWLLSSSIQIAEKYDTSYPKLAEWRQMLKNLTPYPTNDNGLMIGSNQPLDMSHRHFSHLLALYPLFQLNPDTAADANLLLKSLSHWVNIENGKSLAGYSYTGGASLYAALVKGDEARALLQHFLKQNIGIAQLLPNTFYVETNGKNPTLETPLTAASALTELLLQSWGDKIRVFPALPADWQTACFDRLTAQGGFEVSASLEKGQVAWVKIKSQAGQPCIVKIPNWTTAHPISKGRKMNIQNLGNNTFSIDLKKNEAVLLTNTEGVNPTLFSVQHVENIKNFYGVKKGQNIKIEQVWQIPEGF